jgi:uncharacterized coiled-coil DUF342 family protein
MNIANKKRGANWERIAKEFQSERDALCNDVWRMQQERDEARAEADALRAELRELNWMMEGLRK